MALISGSRRTRGHAGRISRGYYFVAPAMIYFVAMVIGPALYSVVISFQSGSIYTKEYSWGLANYTSLASDPRFLTATWHTAVYAVLVAMFHVLLGFLLAVALRAVKNSTVRAVFRTMILIPWAVAPVVVAQMARFMYNPELGPIPALLRAANLDIVWALLGDPKTALLAIIIVDIWHWTPYFMLMIEARLQSIDPFTYEAAQVDGASAAQRLVFITLPETRRLLLTLGAFGLAASAMYFDLVWNMTAGGPAWSSEVLATYIYQAGFFRLDFGMASSAGLVLAVISVGLSILALRLMKKD